MKQTLVFHLIQSFFFIGWSKILIATGIVFFLAIILGIIMILVAKKFQLPSNPLKEELIAALPGANCGGCGYPGCDGYAQYLADGGSDTTLCTAGGPECALELAFVLGIEAQAFEPKRARLICQGSYEHTSPRYDYLGTQTCNAAHGLLGGPGSCTYGCMGFGDCITVCAFHALKKKDGIVEVDHEKCTACGQCAKICPNKVIQIVPQHACVFVLCQNHWPGARTRKNCSVGCIGCSKCVKTCPVNAITMEGHLATINQAQCTHCDECIEVCPTQAIKNVNAQ